MKLNKLKEEANKRLVQTIQEALEFDDC